MARTAGSLAGIQGSKLDPGSVSGSGHGAIQRIDLLDQVTLPDTTDRRIAGHLAQGFDVVGQQQGLGTHAGSSQCRFSTGMASADDDHVKVVRIVHFITSQIGELDSHRMVLSEKAINYTWSGFGKEWTKSDQPFQFS